MNAERISILCRSLSKSQPTDTAGLFLFEPFFPQRDERTQQKGAFVSYGVVLPCQDQHTEPRHTPLRRNEISQSVPVGLNGYQGHLVGTRLGRYRQPAIPQVIPKAVSHAVQGEVDKRVGFGRGLGANDKGRVVKVEKAIDSRFVDGRQRRRLGVRAVKGFLQVLGGNAIVESPRLSFGRRDGIEAYLP